MTCAVADLVAGTIHAAVEIAAAPDAVFDALVDPEELALWWGSPDTYRTRDWRVDLRPGGGFSTRAKRVQDGRVTEVKGRYLEVERPRLLVHTWEQGPGVPDETVIRVELTPTNAGTRVRVTHSGFAEHGASAAAHTESWRRVLGWLDAHVGRRARARA